MMDQYKAITSGTIFLTIMQAANYGIVFLFYMLAARILSPSEVGSFSLLLMVMSVFNTLTLLALNNAIIKYVSESLGKGDLDKAAASSKKALKLILIVSLPALAIGFISSPIISSYTSTGVYDIVCILSSALILNLTNYYGAVMFGYSMFKQVSVQNIIFTFSSRILGILIAFFGLRVFGLAIGFLLGSLITLSYSIITLKGKMVHSSTEFPSKELLKFSTPIYGGNIIGLAQGWLDVAILSGLVGLKSAGTYYIAVSSIAPLTILWAPLSSALFPTLSSINGRGDYKEMEEIHEKTIKIATAIILPLSIALASVSNTALTTVYGKEYAEASIPFTILASTAILSAYTSIYSTELQSMGKTKPIFVAGLLSTLAYIILLATITLPLKQSGAAVARATMTILGFTILHRELNMKASENLKKSIIVAAIVAITLAPIELLLKTSTITKALIEATAFAITLPIAYKIIKPLNREEIELIKTIIPQKIHTSTKEIEYD